MPSLDHVGIHGEEVPLDLASLELPKQSLYLGNGVAVEGTIPKRSEATINCIRLDTMLPEASFLSLANLKHLDRLEVNVVQNDSLVVQLLERSDSILDYDTWIETDFPKLARHYLQCNERYQMYKTVKRDVPKQLLPNLLNNLKAKPSLVYAVLQQEVETLAQRSNLRNATT